MLTSSMPKDDTGSHQPDLDVSERLLKKIAQREVAKAKESSLAARQISNTCRCEVEE